MCCTCRSPAKVIRDLRLHTRLVGPWASLQGRQAWTRYLQELFFAGTGAMEKGGAEETPRLPVSAPQNLVRKAARDYLQALDHVLVRTAGKSLGAYAGPCSEEEATAAAPASRQVLVLCQDEGPLGFALHWYLMYFLKLRMVGLRDVFHREWNDIKLGLQQAGVWWCVLLTSIVYNMAYGPWEGQAWFAKLQEGAREYWSHASVADPLFLSVYENICRDRGEEPDDSAVHKLPLISELVDASLYQRKGPRVALRRWFSWVGAAMYHNSEWHLRLLTILSIGLKLGLYKSKEDMPWFRGAGTSTKPGAEPAEPEAAQRQEAAQATQAASSISNQPAPAETKRAQMAKDDEEVRKLRQKCKNTMFFCAEVLSREDIQPLVTLICGLAKPFYDSHPQHARD